MLLFVALTSIVAVSLIAAIFIKVTRYDGDTRLLINLSFAYNLMNLVATSFILYLIWRFSRGKKTKRVEDNTATEHTEAPTTTEESDPLLDFEGE